jgi:hypothetical protein
MNRKRISLSGWILAGTALLLCGCQAPSSSRYQISIGNGHAYRPKQQVEVAMDGRSLRTFNLIAPQKIAPTRPRRGDLPQTVTVTWVDENGDSHTGEIGIAETVDPDFSGKLVIQINDDNTLALTQDPALNNNLSPIPWNIPEAWEGSVMIPGFEQ